MANLVQTRQRAKSNWIPRKLPREFAIRRSLFLPLLFSLYIFDTRLNTALYRFVN